MSRRALGWEPKKMKLHREHSARAAENTGAATVVAGSDLSPDKLAAIMAASKPVKASGPLPAPKAAVVRAVLAEDRPVNPAMAGGDPPEGWGEVEAGFEQSDEDRATGIPGWGIPGVPSPLPRRNLPRNTSPGRIVDVRKFPEYDDTDR